MRPATTRTFNSVRTREIRPVTAISVVVRATKRRARCRFRVSRSRQGGSTQISNYRKLPGKNGHCTILPSGPLHRLLSDHDGESTRRSSSPSMATQIQHWAEHHRPGHGDMIIDADGNDVYVGISKADPDKWHVIKRRTCRWCGHGSRALRLRDTRLVRNINRPGWAFVSYEGDYSKSPEAPTGHRSIGRSLRYGLDGSGEIRRIVQPAMPRRLLE